MDTEEPFEQSELFARWKRHYLTGVYPNDEVARKCLKISRFIFENADSTPDGFCHDEPCEK